MILKLKGVFIIVFISLFCACTNQGNSSLHESTNYIHDSSLKNKIEINVHAVAKLKRLKSKYKFGAEEKSSIFPLGYVGILPKESRPLANHLMNKSLERLIQLIKTKHSPTKLQILDEFNIGLNSFNEIATDTEDRERVCHYYSEIMDIIGLDSSNELLNNWLYDEF